MQKILTRKEQEKRNRRNQLIIGIVLVGVMILSTAGYAITSNEGGNSAEKKLNYNGVSFVYNSGYWYFSKGGNDFITRFNPKEIEGKSVLDVLKLNDYKDKALYIAGNKSESVFEIARNFNSNMVLRIQNACISEKDCDENLPIKDCSKDNVIVIKEPEQDEVESVYRVNNCVFIVANSSNQLEYTDAFLFKTFNI